MRTIGAWKVEPLTAHSLRSSHPGVSPSAGKSDSGREVPAVRWGTSLTREAVFPTLPLGGLLGFLGQRNYLVLSHGDAVDAILASAAMPGVLPAVEIDGRHFVDGGAVNNTPISHAVDLGADTIRVLATGSACALTAPPRGALGLALHTLTLAIQQRLATDIDKFEGRVDLRVVPPLCPLAISPTDFGRAAELVARGYDATRHLLATAPRRVGQARLLEPHGHVGGDG